MALSPAWSMTVNRFLGTCSPCSMIFWRGSSVCLACCSLVGHHQARCQLPWRMSCYSPQDSFGVSECPCTYQHRWRSSPWLMCCPCLKYLRCSRGRRFWKELMSDLERDHWHVSLKNWTFSFEITEMTSMAFLKMILLVLEVSLSLSSDTQTRQHYSCFPSAHWFDASSMAQQK